MIRIRKVGNEYISEIQHKRFLRKPKWIPFETYTGSKEAFPFLKYEDCLKSALFKLKCDIITNSSK